MVRVWVVLSAAIFAGVGLWTLVDPVGALAPVGVAVLDDRGIVELRAMYGGMELGMATFLAWTLSTSERTRTGLVAACLSIGGLGLVRLVSWFLLRPPGMLLPALCAVELIGAALGVFALWRSRDETV